jgi:hypothetical protein
MKKEERLEMEGKGLDLLIIKQKNGLEINDLNKRTWFTILISQRYIEKYILGLQLEEDILYTVWGTDMLAEEKDKLLVDNNRLIVFKSLNNLKTN